MSPCFVLGRENVPCVAEVVKRSFKADCTDFSYSHLKRSSPRTGIGMARLKPTALPRRIVDELYKQTNVNKGQVEH